MRRSHDSGERIGMDASEKARISRAFLESSLKTKADMHAQYIAEAEQLEAQAASLRRAADEIAKGIQRTQEALDKQKGH